MNKLFALFFVCLMLLAAPAFAVLSAEQSAVVTATDTLITDIITMAWAFVLSVTGALVGMKLFKRFFHKGTS